MLSRKRSLQALAALLQTGATGLSIGLAAADAAAATTEPVPATKSVAERLEAIRGSVAEAWQQGVQDVQPHVAIDPETKLAWWGNGWHNGGWRNGGWHNGGWGNGGWHNSGWGNGGLVGDILSPLIGTPGWGNGGWRNGGWHNGFRNW